MGSYYQFCSMLLNTAEECSRLCASKPRSTLQEEKEGRAAKEDSNRQMGPDSGRNAHDDEKEGENKHSASLQNSSRLSISLSVPKGSTEGQLEDTQVEMSEPPRGKGAENGSSKQEPAPEKEPTGDTSSSVELTPKPPQPPSLSSSSDSNRGQSDKEREEKKETEKKEEEEVTQASSEVALPTLDHSEKVKEPKPTGLSCSSERSLKPPSIGAPLGSKSVSQMDTANAADVLLKDPDCKHAPEQSGEEQGKGTLDLKPKTPGVLVSGSERTLRPSAGVTLPPLTSQSSSAVAQNNFSGRDALQRLEKGSSASKSGTGRRSSADRSTAGERGKPKGELVGAKSEQNLTAASHCETGALSAQSLTGIDRVQFEGRGALEGGVKGRAKESTKLIPGEKHGPEGAPEANDPPPPDPVMSREQVPPSSGLSSASVQLLPLVKQQASPLSSQSDSRMGEGSGMPLITVQGEDGAAVAPGKAGDQPPDKDSVGLKTEVGGGDALAPHRQEEKGATQLSPPQDLTGEGSPAVTPSSTLSPTSSSTSLPTVTDNSGLLTESQRTEDGDGGRGSSSGTESTLPFGIVYHPPALTPPHGVKVGEAGERWEEGSVE